MANLLMAILRVAWAGIFGWLATKYGVEIDDATKTQVIAWTNGILLVASAFLVEIAQHIVWPRIKKWYDTKCADAVITSKVAVANKSKKK